MRLLVLGGTRFLGRALVESALARGHELTLFNRGQTNADLFPEVEKIRGDRTVDLSPLDGREWDAVLDVATSLPRVARRGALKAACEDIVVDTFGERALIVRPGLIVGPHDPTDRFTYWPRRVAGGGSVLAPAPPDQPVQFIDVRDLADWIVIATEKKRDGVYNATGDTITFEQLLDDCRRVAGVRRSSGCRQSASWPRGSVSGWSSRSGSSRPSTRRRTAPMCRKRSEPGSASGRSRTRSRTRSCGTPCARSLALRASACRLMRERELLGRA